MNLLIAAISIFALGFVLNDLTSVPTLVVIAACLAIQIGVVIAYSRKGKK